MGWGPGKSRVIDEKRHFEKPIELSPLVAIDRERCILCYRCVRFSQEVAEDEQLQLLERGDRTFVGTFDDRPYVAPFHGNITDLCPVGALTNYTYRFRARPWDIEQAGSVCTLCPSQCNVSFTVRDEKVKRVIARDNPEVDDGWLCDRGRYGFEMFARRGAGRRAAAARRRPRRAGTRRSPKARRSGLQRGRRAERRRDRRRRLQRGGLPGPAHPARGARLARTSTRAPRAARAARRCVRLAQPELSAKVRDIDEADAILVLGTDPLHSSPILDLRIRKAIRRNGAKLAVATERPTAARRRRRGDRPLRPGRGRPLPRRAGQRPASGTEQRRQRRGRRDPARRPSKVVVVWGERIGRERADAADALLDLAAALDIAEQGRRRPARNPRHHQRPRPARGRLPPRRRPGPAARPAVETAKRRQGHRGDPRGPRVRRAQGPDPLRRRPAARLPGHRRPGKRALTAADFVVAFSMLRERHHRQGRRRLPARDPRRERRHRHAPRRPPAARPPSAPRAPATSARTGSVLVRALLALGHDTGIASQPSAFAALADAVPFYAGIDGRRHRRPRHPLAGHPSRRERPRQPGVRRPTRRTLSARRRATASEAQRPTPSRVRRVEGGRRRSPSAPTATSGPARSPS